MKSLANALTSTKLHLPDYTFVETIYQGGRTAVHRALVTATQQPVVIKVLSEEYPSFAELVQFRNQYTVAKNLSIPGIVQPFSLKPYGHGYALVMADFAGLDLGQYAQQSSLSLTEILSIALQLADILHELHQHRIIHKDLKPANILIHPDSKQVKLIDFSIASLLPKETQALQSPKSLEGTLAYLAPEQTGRMNRAIDYRTDFYALGVTLYELLTGQLPFASDDPLEVIHCHMAQVPTAVVHVQPQVPEMVSEIVAKLMAKNAEDRYQSALGLKHDLEKCLTQWQACGVIVDFELGQRDVSDRFLIPEKLYGREREVQTLLDAFERVAEGHSEMVLVAGFSGIGKTAVVNEVHKPIARQRGYFIKGKFDQFNRNLPFSAFVQAFRDLMGQLLGESDADLNAWKENILAAVGENGQVLIEVIPELERIIGAQRPVAELAGTAAQNRFNLVLQKFIAVFTTSAHPLTLFLDDLQWADSASLNLLKVLMGNSQERHLLLLGAYRDNEVFPAHPLMLCLAELEKQRAAISTITLIPLGISHVNQLVAETLNCTVNLSKPLTDLVYQKTQGNPFFTTQFLQGLYADGLIQFERNKRYWECDLVRVRNAALTDDVVEFMAGRLHRLSRATQTALQLAACIGNQFDLETLAIICDAPAEEVAADLWEALREGLILPQSQAYKFFQGREQTDGAVDGMSIHYRFLHDRVQQAAYSLIPDEDKHETHVQIGQLLFHSTPEKEIEERVFDIVNHFNIGLKLVTAASEREQLCQLNLKAAIKAKRATAYETAYQYALASVSLLPTEGWKNQYYITLNLHELTSELAYLKGDFKTSQQYSETIQTHAQTTLDEVKAHEISLLVHVAQRQSSQAIVTGQQILERLGVSIPTASTSADIQQAWAEVSSLMPANQDAQSLLDLPTITAPHALAALQILNSMAATVYLTQPQLFPLIVLAQVKLSLLHGNTPVSAGAYARYSFMLCSKRNEIVLGYEFGRLALSLAENFGDQGISTRVLLMVGALTLPWKIHLKESIPLLQEAYRNGLESGNLDGAALSHFYESQSSYLVGEELQDLADKVSTYSAQIQQTKQGFHFGNNALLHQVILNLIGDSESLDQISGEAFDEAKMLPLYQSSGNMLGLYCLYLHKAILGYWFGQAEASLAHIETAAKHLMAATSQATIPLFYFYDSLIRLSLHDSSSAATPIPAQVDDNQKKLEFWASHAPMNFSHKYDLVLAERHRCLGQKLEAMDAYDQAASGAKASGYIQEEALANELAAKFYLDWGKEKVAAGYMQEAYYCYSRWGAKAKVDDLEVRYPDLLRPILQSSNLAGDVLTTLMTLARPTISSHARTCNSSGTSTLNQSLDFASILEASQAMSGNIKLDELLRQLTQIILHNSGGDRCTLILSDGTGEWQVRAIATAAETQLCAEPLIDKLSVPIKLIQYVKNTQEVVIIDDLTTDLPVLDDYLRQHQPKSVLGLPVMHRGQGIGMIVIENRLTSGVFTGDHILILDFLCTQATISIQNSLLYKELEHSLQQAQTTSQELAEVVALSKGQQDILALIAQGLPLTDILTEIALYVESQSHHVAYCSFSMLEAGERLRHAAAPSLSADYIALIDGIGIGPQVGSCGTAAYNKASVTVTDIATDPLWANFQVALEFGLRACASTPILGAEGQVLATLAMYQPTTGQFTLHDRQLMEVATYLARIAIERHQADVELQQINLQMMQGEKMASLGNLVAGVAHEINNPLGFLNGSISNVQEYVQDCFDHIALYQQHSPELEPVIQDHVEEIDLEFLQGDLPKVLSAMQGATERIKNISTSLRIFSRADNSFKSYVNLHEGLNSTLLILKYRLKANERRSAIEVVTDYGNIPEIDCFPGQLNQVFMNILANAIDALDEASQHHNLTEMRAHPYHITIRTGLEDDQVTVAIMDNGPGIPEEIQANIFDHLFTTKAVGKGTGLGLAIARQIIEETHGGKLEMHSELGQGSAFYMRLPC
ncbi:MAG: AAA family ATPase [Cyanobacteria bacterium P01_F01_bin.56]